MSYALHQGFIIAVFSGVSLYTGRILQIIGEKNCVIFGVIFALAGSILMISVAFIFENAPYLTSISMIIYSIGAAISYPVIFVKSLQIFPDIKGTASSAIMSMRALLCAGFIAFSSYVYSGKLITVAAMLLTASVLIILFSIKLLKALPFATKEQKLI